MAENAVPSAARFSMWGMLRARGARAVRAFGPAVLLAVFAALAIVSLARDSATFDETAHVAAGFTYWDRRDFRLNPEHPPLAKMWAALPLWLGGVRDVDYSSEHWRRRDHWRFGFIFLNGPLEGYERREPGRRLIPLLDPLQGSCLRVCEQTFAIHCEGVDRAQIAQP